jgi:hypothetical protein
MPTHGVNAMTSRLPITLLIIAFLFSGDVAEAPAE